MSKKSSRRSASPPLFTTTSPRSLFQGKGQQDRTKKPPCLLICAIQSLPIRYDACGHLQRDVVKEFTDFGTSWLITSVFQDTTPASSVHLEISGKPFRRLERLRLRWYHTILLLHYRTENSSYHFKHRRQIRYDQPFRKPNPKQKNLNYTLCVPGLSWPHLPLASASKYIFSLGCLSSCLL